MRNLSPFSTNCFQMKIDVLFLVFVAANTMKKYKSEKINYIYDKALQHIEDQQRLTRLEKDLNKYDQLYMDTKQEHANAKFSKLSKELGKIDLKLIQMLEQHGLQKTVQAFREKIKHGDEYGAAKEDFDPVAVTFADEGLQQLWSSAQANQFATAELKELYRELKEAEKLMEEHHHAKQALNKVPTENDLHFDHKEDLQQVSNKAKNFKNTHMKLDAHLEKLHSKVKGEDRGIFDSDKVKKMWKLAQTNQKFSADDLKLLKEELIHFDKQIKKFDHHKQLQENRMDGKKSPMEHIEDAELDAKQEKMSRKMRKIEKYLESKIQHQEL